MIKNLLKKLYFLFIIILIIPGCSSNSPKGNEYDVEAYKTLCNAKVFSYDATGYGATMSEEIKAYAKLFKSPNTKEIFLKLENEATIEGKLYALCAFYYLDFDYYKKVVDKYALSNIMLNIQSGCTIDEDKLSEVIKSNDKNAVVLLSNKDTINDWMARNNKKITAVDFYGGGIPCCLKNYIYDSGNQK